METEIEIPPNEEINETVNDQIIENTAETEALSTNLQQEDANNDINDENQSTSTRSNKKTDSEKQKLVDLPISRVKSIMKQDPDCHIISKDAAFLTAKATELFLKGLGKEIYKYTLLGRRKTILKRDFDNAIDSAANLCFLEGSLEQL